MRILLVDDEDAILRILQQTLRHHDTVAVDSGEEAMRLLDAQRFDIVVSDHEIGGCTGVDVLWYAACVHPEGRRIMFSGTPPNELEEHRRAGIIERFVAKPAIAEIGRLCDEESTAA